MKNFIKTNDKLTADKLISEGFKLISQIGSTYTFINQSPEKINFDEIDKTKIV